MLQLPHRHCWLIRVPALALVLPPLCFGVVPAMAAMALIALLATTGIWAALNRKRPKSPSTRARFAGALDLAVLMSTFGCLAALATTGHLVFGSNAAARDAACAWLVLNLAHLAIHPRH